MKEKKDKKEKKKKRNKNELKKKEQLLKEKIIKKRKKLEKKIDKETEDLNYYILINNVLTNFVEPKQEDIHHCVVMFSSLQEKLLKINDLLNNYDILNKQNNPQSMTTRLSTLSEIKNFNKALPFSSLAETNIEINNEINKEIIIENIIKEIENLEKIKKGTEEKINKLVPNVQSFYIKNFYYPRNFCSLPEILKSGYNMLNLREIKISEISDEYKTKYKEAQMKLFNLKKVCYYIITKK